MSAGLAYLLGVATVCLCVALWRPVCRLLNGPRSTSLLQIRNPSPPPVPGRRRPL